MGAIDRHRLHKLFEAELRRFEELHPKSAASVQTRDALFGGVPMPWMMHWAGEYPVVVDHAEGARLTDIDGNEYVDFCLGDTGAMTGHSPAPVVEAASRQLARGATTMLPTEDAGVVGDQLASRFGLPQWLLTISATDANRTALRFARQLTGRPKIVVFSYSYHGTVDETFAVRDPATGQTIAREGSVGPAFDVAETTRAIEFNDVDQLAHALQHEDVAVVITEPAMTNMGIVLPDEGYHQELRELTRKHGTLLLIDETHTFSAGYGGATRAWDLEPDMFTIGKAVGGGVPVGALGLSEGVASALLADPDADFEDVGGVGGTLAGSALAMASMRAALTEVLTEEAFTHAIDVATELREGISEAIAKHGLTWDVQQLGCRVEYRFTREAPRNGTESRAGFDGELERYLHLHALNRGVLITPFHNMLLACGATRREDAHVHSRLFSEALGELV
ncbi:MAG: aminotransferase class III-fold pyridoxal phosphate-dependent enzyme [Solirubrobacteraceae bacterium]|nr:aminotransferase class III-fold pyridoxal phosphate-dependent enzyme [Solirubrobacteraceae bacterium]